jgi:UDP-N-acetyl-D-mannosaminuronic acid dehydrogenase
LKVLGGIQDFPTETESLYLVARSINSFMPVHTANLTETGLLRAGKQIEGARIALLGWAFIPNTGDSRNTPSKVFFDHVTSRGATVSVHDPYVKEEPGISISGDVEPVLKGADAVVIFTGHSLYKSLQPARCRKITGARHPVIVDGRNIIDPDAFIRDGWIYLGIGRGDLNNHPVID